MNKTIAKLFFLIGLACLFSSCFPNTVDIYIICDPNQGTMKVDDTEIDPIKCNIGFVSLSGEDSFYISANGSMHKIEFIPMDPGHFSRG